PSKGEKKTSEWVNSAEKRVLTLKHSSMSEPFYFTNFFWGCVARCFPSHALPHGKSNPQLRGAQALLVHRAARCPRRDSCILSLAVPLDPPSHGSSFCLPCCR